MKRNINRIISENIDKYLLKEIYDIENKDITNWIKIGEIDYSPYMGSKTSDLYVNPNNPTEHLFAINGKPWGDKGNLPSYARQYVKIYDEYKDTPYAEPFLGKTKTEEDLKKHQVFMNMLNIQNGQVVLKHYSNARITDGVVSEGHGHNNFSNNSDIGCYFWATQSIGQDPSNDGRYVYYCKVDPSQIYDFQNDMERIGNINKAAKEKDYVGVIWNDTRKNSICVVTHKPTPISYIYDKTKGKFYNPNWEKME